MGRYVNKWFSNSLAIATLLVMLVTSALTLPLLFLTRAGA
jgi:hypothetical protein